MILIEGTEWWSASWFGVEAKGSTPLEAAERLAGRLRSLRHGFGAPGVGEDVGGLREAWPAVEPLLSRVLARVQEPEEGAEEPPGADSLRAATLDAERVVVMAALREERGNLTKTSRRLGLSRFGLLKKVRRLDLYKEAKRLKWEAP